LTARLGAPANSATLALIAATGLTVVGLALRLGYFDEQSLFGDDLSTAWVVQGQGIGGVIERVQTDQEITPPLYFLVTWLTAKLGDSTAWLQLPSVLAGIALIPLVYLLGVKTVGRPAALVGAALTALNPHLIFYSAETRAYALVVLLVLLSTLALLTALDTGRRRWWAAYAAFSCAGMYTHYTAAFALGAQVLWVLWAHRESWRALLVANGIAAIGFLPWLPSYIDDSESPTTGIIEFIHPFGAELAADDVARWAVGFPHRAPGYFPGTIALALLVAGLLIALGSVAKQVSRRYSARLTLRPPPRLVLVVLLALSLPVGSAVYSVLGEDVFVSRNLIASWPGFAVSIGALLTAVAAPLRAVAVAVVLTAYCIGAVKLFDEDFRRPDYDSVAQFINRTGQPGDPVIDDEIPTGGPITTLEGTDPEPGRIYVLGEHPRLPGPIETDEARQPLPPLEPASVAESAIRSADGRRLFVVVNDERPAQEAVLMPPPAAQVVVDNLPRGFRLAGAAHFPAMLDLSVYRYEDAREVQ
jgi:Dolichyl-phosphate-mannose-protein mannosyltransferase